MEDCIFCQIVHRRISAPISYEDDLVLVFDDIDPKAPIHKLIIPQKHIATLNEVVEEDSFLLGHMIQISKRLAKQNAIDEAGYRIIMNCNAWGGQTVFHLHMHLMGGRQLAWKN